MAITFMHSATSMWYKLLKDEINWAEILSVAVN